jgi:hypothetical protein
MLPMGFEHTIPVFALDRVATVIVLWEYAVLYPRT